MKRFCLRLLRLLCGLFVYALGVALKLNANIGYSPWDVFHTGLADTTGISVGTAMILAGIVIIIALALMGEKFGIGTVFNILLIGNFLDLILATGVIPIAGSVASGTVMLVAGLFMLSIAMYLYIGAGFGTGPRDGLMVAMTRKTGLPIGVCRGVIEFIAFAAGWFLGGMVGLGTVISVIAIGPCVQLVFRLFRFDATKVKHETLLDTWLELRSMLKPDTAKTDT